MSAKPRRLGLYVPWALFLVFCVGWTAHWFMVRDSVLRALDSARLPGSTYSLKYAAARVSGFPLRLTVTFDRFYLDAGNGMSAWTDTLPLSINLSNPRHLIIGQATTLHWTAFGVGHSMDAARGELSLRFDDKAELVRASIRLENANIGNAWGPQTRAGRLLGQSRTKIGVLLVHARPDPRAPRDLQLVVDAKDWSGDAGIDALTALGPFKTVRAAIVLTEPRALASAQPFKDWRGEARIEQFDLSTANIAVTGKGALSLDSQQRPTGELSVSVNGAGAQKLVAQDGWWALDETRLVPAKAIQHN